MSILNFQQVDEIKIEPLKLDKSRKFVPKFCFEDSFYFCNCNHPDTGHRLTIGKCYYEGCNCQKFVQKDLELVVEITLEDLFVADNKIVNDDSPQFWLEFKTWKDKYDSKNI